MSGESDSVPHQFNFADPEQVSGGEHVSEAVAMLFPGLRGVFTIAKYSKGDHIGSHNDKAHIEVPVNETVEDGPTVRLSQTLSPRPRSRPAPRSTLTLSHPHSHAHFGRCSNHCPCLYTVSSAIALIKAFKVAGFF